MHAQARTCGAPPATRRTRVLALTYCRYPPIPSLASDTTNRRHLDYCTPLPAAYALHPCPALPGAVARALGPWPPARSSQVPTTPAQCSAVALPAFAHALPQNHGADCSPGLGRRGLRSTAEKRLGNLQAKGFRLVFPAWGPASISVELYPPPPAGPGERAVSCRHPLVPFRTYWRIGNVRSGGVRYTQSGTVR